MPNAKPNVSDLSSKHIECVRHVCYSWKRHWVSRKIQKPNSNSNGYWDVSVETQKDLYWENAIQNQLTPVYWNSLENQLTKLIRLKHTLWRAIFFSAAHCVYIIKATRWLLCIFILHWHFYWVQSIKSQQGFNGQNSTEYQMTSFNWNSIEFLLTKIK